VVFHGGPPLNLDTSITPIPGHYKRARLGRYKQAILARERGGGYLGSG
jgi:hypothetical protein